MSFRSKLPFDGMNVPMAIICKCRDFNFRFNVGSCVTTSFSTSEPASITLFSFPPAGTAWMISSWPIFPLGSVLSSGHIQDGTGKVRNRNCRGLAAARGTLYTMPRERERERELSRGCKKGGFYIRKDQTRGSGRPDSRDSHDIHL